MLIYNNIKEMDQTGINKWQGCIYMYNNYIYLYTTNYNTAIHLYYRSSIITTNIHTEEIQIYTNPISRRDRLFAFYSKYKSFYIYISSRCCYISFTNIKHLRYNLYYILRRYFVFSVLLRHHYKNY